MTYRCTHRDAPDSVRAVADGVEATPPILGRRRLGMSTRLLARRDRGTSTGWSAWAPAPNGHRPPARPGGWFHDGQGAAATTRRQMPLSGAPTHPAGRRPGRKGLLFTKRHSDAPPECPRDPIPECRRQDHATPGPGPQESGSPFRGRLQDRLSAKTDHHSIRQPMSMASHVLTDEPFGGSKGRRRDRVHRHLRDRAITCSHPCTTARDLTLEESDDLGSSMVGSNDHLPEACVGQAPQHRDRRRRAESQVIARDLPPPAASPDPVPDQAATLAELRSPVHRHRARPHRTRLGQIQSTALGACQPPRSNGSTASTTHGPRRRPRRCVASTCSWHPTAAVTGTHIAMVARHPEP